MKRLWKIFRAVMVVLLLIAVVLPVGVYVFLSTPWASNWIRSLACERLEQLLGAEVEIGQVMLHPFNRLTITDISVKLPDESAPALTVGRVSAAFELRHFISTRQLMIDYAVVEGLDLALRRDSVGSPLNIDPIIARLRRPDSGEPPRLPDLRINAITLLDSRLSYDVASVPMPLDSAFCPNHIAVDHMRLNASVVMAPDADLDITLNDMRLHERSGLAITGLSTSLRADDRSTMIGTTSLAMAGSHLVLEPIVLPAPIAALGSVFDHAKVDVAIRGGASLIALSDLAPLAPVLAGVDMLVSPTVDATVWADGVQLRTFSLADAANPKQSLTLSGTVTGLRGGPDSLNVDLRHLAANVRGATLRHALTAASVKVPATLEHLCPSYGTIGLRAHGRATTAAANLVANITLPGGIAVAATGRAVMPTRSFDVIDFTANAGVKHFDAAVVSPTSGIGSVTADISCTGHRRGRSLTGDISLAAAEIATRRYSFHDIDLNASFDGSNLTAHLDSHDPAASGRADISLDNINGADGVDLRSCVASVSVDCLDLDAIGVTNRWRGRVLSFNADADLAGTDIDHINGTAALHRVSWVDSLGVGLWVDSLVVKTYGDDYKPHININGDFINGIIQGRCSLRRLVADARSIGAAVMPTLVPEPAMSFDPEHVNDFDYEITLTPSHDLTGFFGLPFFVIGSVTVDGEFDSAAGFARITIDAPNIVRGNNLIQTSLIHVEADREQGTGTVYATTQMPTKKGDLSMALIAHAGDNAIDTHIDWSIERTNPLMGSMAFVTDFMRDDDNRVCGLVSFKPGDITFGGDVWSINPSTIGFSARQVEVHDFDLTSDKQRISIDGAASAIDPDRELTVDIANLNLINIFETLNIDNVLISGLATGTIRASGLLGGKPLIRSERLRVTDIGYNYCTLGNADVEAWFDTDDAAFEINADISQFDGRHSFINGRIWPATESLDMTFRADRVPVGFMRHYMSAFASSVAGFASGRARIFGTFKYIDMEGDILAEDLKLGIDFTNTVYTCTDSIHMRPGLIDVPPVTMTDVSGHTARIEGKVWHKFFKEPSFDFSITEAENFLCYNTTARNNPDWYGTIRGNGSASITGEPGVVNIGTNMSTAEGSVFTFVLNDRIDASDFSFITFRDRTNVEITDSLLQIDPLQQAVAAYKKHQGVNNDRPSAYNMSLQVDITPAATMILVMDPVGGDQIKAVGSGNLSMTYQSIDDELRMRGTYILDDGKYNFTLQDIIRKDFTITPGSSITFTGDPYSAQLDVEAMFPVNVNLSDLDESFTTDPDLNRTNVRVVALLKVTGDMRQPDISFDLSFPNLSTDTYRKVKSIISTEEMMNRQIIYLLALNRFYTPDYMASTTKGNELFSVASSTISGQLSNMLGKLSDNWSIAPNLRSDRGDFSDVEVDVVLSSRLLDNRLLFNGNFGYRDKSLNTNQFVGDFDVQYLLDRRGHWRLKAYNRYNDQSYYLRTATTTQGVGIMLRHDFDSLLPRFGHRSTDADTTATEHPADIVPAAIHAVNP